MLTDLLILGGNVLFLAFLIATSRTLLLWRHNIFLIAFLICFSQFSGILLLRLLQLH